MSAFPLLSGDEQTSDERAKNGAHDPERTSRLFAIEVVAQERYSIGLLR